MITSIYQEVELSLTENLIRLLVICFFFVFRILIFTTRLFDIWCFWLGRCGRLGRFRRLIANGLPPFSIPEL